jgi:hypothetical protein
LLLGVELNGLFYDLIFQLAPCQAHGACPNVVLVWRLESIVKARKLMFLWLHCNFGVMDTPKVYRVKKIGEF